MVSVFSFAHTSKLPGVSRENLIYQSSLVDFYGFIMTTIPLNKITNGKTY